MDEQVDITDDLQQLIKESEQKIEENKRKEDEKKKNSKQPPVCARCHKPKKTTKHHWPLSSSRLVPICTHCYNVTKKQRKRAAKFNGR